MEQLMMGIITVIIVLIIRRKEAFVFRWSPDQNTWVAVGTGLLAWAFSTAMLCFDREAVISRVIHYGLIYVVCGAILPWGYTFLVERQGPAALGIRRERWGVSLIAGIVLAALLSLIFVFEADWNAIDWGQFAKALVVLNGAGGLFELFLYYGFIHLRLEKAFGVLPAIVLTSLFYVAWHTGTQLPLEPDILLGVIKLFGVGLMYQAVFSTTRHLLTIWPLFHAVGVMIDFTVNLDGISYASARLPWAMGTLVTMALVVAGLLWWSHPRKL